MTKQEVQQYFPDTYDFFRSLSDEHPFWHEMQHVHLRDAKKGNTLLSDLEQVFSSLHMLDGHHVIQDRLHDVETTNELMELLTRLYVAYLYRQHHSKLMHTTDHQYDIELEIADQLLALGVVQFTNFDSLTSQFSDEIKADLDFMEQVGNGGAPASGFIDRLRQRAKDLKEHPTAHHQLLAAVTDHAHFPRQYALVQHLRDSREEMEEHFPHLAGILLIDPTPGRERASFVSFHADAHDLEILLNKIG